MGHENNLFDALILVHVSEQLRQSADSQALAVRLMRTRPYRYFPFFSTDGILTGRSE